MKLLINEYPLQVLPGLAKEIGLNEAIFLQQMHYWLKKSKNIRQGRPWVFNTADIWLEQFPFWSKRTLWRIVKSLKNRGLIETSNKFNRNSYDKTNWYTINYETLSKLEMLKATGQSDQRESKALCQNGTMVGAKTASPIPETTREYKRLLSVVSQQTPATINKKIKPLSEHAWFTRWWCHSFQTVTGTKYVYSPKSAGLIKRMIKSIGYDALTARACAYLTLPSNARYPRGDPTIEGLETMINQIVSLINPELGDRCKQLGIFPHDEEMELIDFQPWLENVESESAAC